MKLYIWQGNNISDAYHNDGTLVVLAETVEQAREIASQSAVPLRPGCGPEVEDAWDRGDAWMDGMIYVRGAWEPNPAINRDPERIVELDAPCVVAFNGGGYD